MRIHIKNLWNVIFTIIIQLFKNKFNQRSETFTNYLYKNNKSLVKTMKTHKLKISSTFIDCKN